MTESYETQLINVDVTLATAVETLAAGGNEPHALKMVWRVGGSTFKPYFVDLDLVENSSRKIRQTLEKIVKKGVEGDIRGGGLLLKELAGRGYELYELLFIEPNGARGQEVRDWLETREPGRYRMNVTVDSRIHIPWGLVYDVEPSELTGEPGDEGIELYQDFWCFKYMLSSIYNKFTPKDIGEQPMPADIFKILSVMHKEEFDKAFEHLSDGEREILSWITDNYEYKDHIYESKDLFQRWERVRSEINLLYFYCHADENKLELSPQDIIEMEDFIRKVSRPGTSIGKSGCMVFLNGCVTAVGKRTGGFMEATGRSGFCGFIGTEAPIPKLFALRFGIAFLYYFLYKQMPVYRIMDELRRQHWPLGLLYSTCCHPDMRIKWPVAQPPLSAAPQGNYSCVPVGDLYD